MEGESPAAADAADKSHPVPELPDLPDFPHFSLDATFSSWVHDHVDGEHIGGVSTILGTSTARSYRQLTQAATLIHGLPRFAARVAAGEFTVAHVLAAVDLCRTVAFRHLPRLDLHLATRRADVTADTLRAALRKLIHLLESPQDRAEIASQRRRVDVDTFADGSACLSVTAPADEIHAAYARVQAMARAVHAGQSNTFNLPSTLEIIDERSISALMCDIFLRPQPKLSIRVREVDPVTGIESHREASLLDENGDLRFRDDESGVSGLTDLLDPARRETAPMDPAPPGGVDAAPADPSRDGSTASGRFPAGASFFPDGLPQPTPLEYEIVIEMPTTQESLRSQAAVMVTVPFLTLIGEADLPGVLADGSPIPAETARRIASGAPSLTRILTDPATGTPLDAQATSYQIPKPVRKTLIAQWETCTFPGCTRPAEKAEIDHVAPFNHANPLAGGFTRFGNLHPLCKKHHAQKTARRYAVEMADRGTAPNRLEYEFPHGLKTTIHPPDQPIEVEHALRFYDIVGMKPCRWRVPGHEVPDESRIVEVLPTEAHARVHAAEQRRREEIAARDARMRAATARSNEARRRRRLEQLLDWEHAEFPKCLPPGPNPLTMKALPPGTSDPYSDALTADAAARRERSATRSSLIWRSGRRVSETEPPTGHCPQGPTEPITGHRTLSQRRKDYMIWKRARMEQAAKAKSSARRRPSRKRTTSPRRQPAVPLPRHGRSSPAGSVAPDPWTMTLPDSPPVPDSPPTQTAGTDSAGSNTTGTVTADAISEYSVVPRWRTQPIQWDHNPADDPPPF